VFKAINTLHESSFKHPYNPQPGVVKVQGFKPSGTYGVLGWNDAEIKFHTIGSFLNKSQWREMEEQARPPAVSFVGHCPEDNRPAYVGIVVKSQRLPQAQFAFRK
jgi:hypothetical protein